MVREFLAAEIAIFAAAASMHAGLFGPDHVHVAARNAETVIGLVLVAGFVAIGLRPERTRRYGLLAQGFGLLGTCVGLFTIAVGVGPRTVVDLVLHATMIVLFVGGLRAAARFGTTRHA